MAKAGDGAAARLTQADMQHVLNNLMGNLQQQSMGPSGRRTTGNPMGTTHSSRARSMAKGEDDAAPAKVSVRDKLTQLLTDFQVDDSLSADSIYSMTFTWVKILYKDDAQFFRHTFLPFTMPRAPGEEHAWLWEFKATPEPSKEARPSGASIGSTQTPQVPPVKNSRYLGCLNLNGILRLAKLLVTWFVMVALVTTISLQVIMLVMLYKELNTGANGKVWELSLLNADRPFEVGLAAIVSAMVMFFYLCSDYDNAIRMILIDTGDEVGVSRVRVSNWTALLAFLQATVTHGALYFSLKIIRGSESVAEVLMDSVGLTFIVDIDEMVGATVASTFRDGSLMFDQIVTLVDDESTAARWINAMVMHLQEVSAGTGSGMSLAQQFKRTAESPKVARGLETADAVGQMFLNGITGAFRSAGFLGGTVIPMEPTGAALSSAGSGLPSAAAGLGKHAFNDTAGEFDSLNNTAASGTGLPVPKRLTLPRLDNMSPQLDNMSPKVRIAASREPRHLHQHASDDLSLAATLSQAALLTQGRPLSSLRRQSGARFMFKRLLNRLCHHRSSKIDVAAAFLTSEQQLAHELENELEEAQTSQISRAFLLPLSIFAYAYIPAFLLLGRALFSYGAPSESDLTEIPNYSESTISILLFISICTILLGSKLAVFALAYYYAREKIRKQAKKIVQSNSKTPHPDAESLLVGTRAAVFDAPVVLETGPSARSHPT